MNRKQLILKYFQKKDQLTVENKKYKKSLIELFQWLVKTDEVENDITTKTLDLRNDITTTIIAKQDGIIAGLEEISFLIKTFLLDLTVRHHVKSGKPSTINHTLLTISGPSRTVLANERTIINILGRMSGIATQTNQIIKKIETDTLHIAATRKTPWNMLDKKAVAVGGGLTHRLNLADEIMIKDNHLAALKQQHHSGNDTTTIQHCIKIMQNNKVEFFEIEVENISQAQTAVQTFSQMFIQNQELRIKNHLMTILLDNLTPKQVANLVNKVKKTDVYNHVLFEASGDITEENIDIWTTTGVDIISLGSLTHSAQNFNLSMKVEQD